MSVPRMAIGAQRMTQPMTTSASAIAPDSQSLLLAHRERARLMIAKMPQSGMSAHEARFTSASTSRLNSSARAVE